MKPRAQRYTHKSIKENKECINEKLIDPKMFSLFQRYYMAPGTDQFKEWSSVEFQYDDKETTLTRIKI